MGPSDSSMGVPMVLGGVGGCVMVGLGEGVGSVGTGGCFRVLESMHNDPFDLYEAHDA